jgi:hypothetical protein
VRTAGQGVTDLGGAEITVAADGTVVTADGAELLRMPGGPAARVVAEADLIEVVVDGTSGVGVARRGP